MSWRENAGGGSEKGFVGHFVNPAIPTFVLDQRDVPLTPSGQADVGTPFFLFADGTNPRSLFADAYQPGTPVTGAASVVMTNSVDGRPA